MDEEQAQTGPSVAGVAKAGASIANYTKKALTLIRGAATVVTFGGPVGWIGGGLVAAVVFFILPMFVVFILMLSIGGGEIGYAEPEEPLPGPPGPPVVGDGIGLLKDYCIRMPVAPPPYPSAPTDEEKCSQEFRKLLETVANWAKMPAGVLAGVASIEGRQMFSYTDAQILDFVQAGKEDPHNNPSPNDNNIDNCNPSPAGALGPMQFMPGTWDGGGDKYHEAVNIATGEGRAEDICNIKDALYASAWMLKCNSGGVPAAECGNGNFTNYDYDDSNKQWEGPPGPEGEADGSQGEVYNAAERYLGACVANGFEYCLTVWNYYQTTKDTGASGAPWGWPTSGTITLMPYVSHHKSDVDIAFAGGGQPVYATQDGQIWTDDEPGGCGHYIIIFGSKYATFYCHFNAYSPCVNGLNDNDWVKTGTYLGDTGWSGWVEPPGPGGAHLHYQIREDDGATALTLEEFNSLLPTTYSKGSDVVTSYTGKECLLGQ